MAGRCNPNKAKIHRSYTVEEMAYLYSAHKNTIRAWIKNGLPVCDNKKPLLVLGSDLREFIRVKNKKNKRKCRLYEMYCFRCKSPQKPAGNMVEYKPTTGATGRLTGFCSSCDCMINKCIRFADYMKIQRYFTEETKTHKQVGFPPLKQ